MSLFQGSCTGLCAIYSNVSVFWSTRWQQLTVQYGEPTAVSFAGVQRGSQWKVKNTVHLLPLCGAAWPWRFLCCWSVCPHLFSISYHHTQEQPLTSLMPPANKFIFTVLKRNKVLCLPQGFLLYCRSNVENGVAVFNWYFSWLRFQGCMVQVVSPPPSSLLRYHSLRLLWHYLYLT